MLCSRCQDAPALPLSPAHLCEACAEAVWAKSVKWLAALKAREAAKRPSITHQPSAPGVPACVRVDFEDGRVYLCRIDPRELGGVRVTFRGQDLEPATDPHSLYFAAYAQELAAMLQPKEQP